MSIKLTCLNERGLRDQGKVAHLLHDFSSFGVDVAVIQQIHIVCDVDSCVLSTDFVQHMGTGFPEVFLC